MTRFRAVALAAAFGAVAAVEASAQPVIGFRLGLSMSKASTELTEFEGVDREWLTKFTGGGFIRFDAGMIGVQPELLYVTKGIRFTDEATDDQADIRLDYIEVPILLHLQLGAGPIAPYVVAGPAFAFEAGCSLKISTEGASIEVDCDDDEDELERKKFDVGAMFGAGFGFAAGPGSIIVDGRYNLGLMNIVEDTPDAELKHRAFYFTAGYQIPLGIR